MGIELPSPQGEQFGSGDNAERIMPKTRVENLQAQHSVEINATESPSSQEARTGQGTGDGNGPSAQASVAITTTSSAVSDSSSSVSLDDVPVVAADEDLIEKQWVDSVKRIVKETRSDPYRQGVAINRLQIDYLQKRYGKTMGGGENV